ncbi:MAG: hypothetical protein IT370_30460 [Deltaproteobacteria bacterium]|nr:hypothetical protein [Deltaproteobacteria bacterium]
MMRWLERRLSSRWAPVAAIALAVALMLPSLSTGLVADDHLHEVMLRSPAPIPALAGRRFDPFRFAPGDPAATQALQDAGVFPWTADPHARLAFWRPLAAATHVLDHALWPDSAPLRHLHNLAWFALALLAVAAVHRRFLGATWIGALALLLYAIDDVHGPAVGWIANRNAMIAVALSLPALVWHDRWVRDGWRPGALLAPLALALGLGAGEAALAVTAYLAAYTLHVDRARWATRVAHLVPYLVVVVVWHLIYVHLGYGASRSGIYLDPGGDLVAFAAAIPRRAPGLLASQLALPWSDLVSLYPYLSPRLPLIMLGLALLVLAGVAWLLAPLWRRDDKTRFFATGMLLAVLPICATFPADRLLWFVGLGATGLLARLLAEPRTTRARKLAAGTLIAIHLVLAPLFLLLRSRTMDTVERPLARAEASIPRTPDITGKTVVLVNPPSDLLAAYVMVTRASRGTPAPARLRWLAAGTSAAEVERVDARTLRIRPARGYLADTAERMLRSPRARFAVGDHVDLSGLRVEVTALSPDGRPAEASFSFDVALDDPSLLLLQWSRGGYVPFTPPPPGGHVTLPGTSFLDAVFGKGS